MFRREFRRRAQATAALLREACDHIAARQLIIAFVFVCAAGALTALAPVALRACVDQLAARGISTDALPRVLPYLSAFVLCLWFGRVLEEFRSLAYGSAHTRLSRRLSHRLFAHVLDLPLAFHLERRTGALSQTHANGLEGAQLLLYHVVFTFLPVLIELIVITAVLVQLGFPKILGVLGIAFIIYVVVFAVGVSRVSLPARGASAAHIDANAVLTDSILNYELVKYFVAEPLVRQRYDVALWRLENQWREFYRRKAANGFSSATVFAGALSASAALAAHEVGRGSMTIGDFVLVTTYTMQLVRPVEMLGYAIQDVSRAFAFLDKTLDLLSAQTEPQVCNCSVPAPRSGALSFQDVSFCYQPGRRILSNLSFEVPAGSSLAIVGASGAGKSSIIRLLLRLTEPETGRILLDGTPIADLPLAVLRSGIAVVPQDTVLFNDTIAYNIGFGRPSSTRREIELAARQARIHDLIMSLPSKYDTIVGERGVKLSGGEKQRIAIARAALRQPKLFVLDEATSSLDSKTEQEVLGNFLEITHGYTTLIIAHRLSTIAHADEIIVLDAGSMVERGSHASLLQLGARYAGMWRTQHRGFDTQPSSDSRVA